MLNHFLFSVNTVMPLFFLIALGFILKRTGFLSESFISISNKMLFYILLPTTLFISVYNADFSEISGVGFAAYTIIATTLSVVVTWVIARFFIKDKKVLGSFVQGAFRSNTVFVGIPLMRNIAGEAGVAHFAIILALVMPIYCFFTVLIFSVCTSSKENLNAKSIILTIIKTPLLIGIGIGIALSLLDVRLPEIFTRTLNDLSAMSTPMALICIGGGITFLGFNQKLKFSIIAAIIKVVVLPIAFTIGAYVLGFRGMDLVGFMVLGGLPSAIIGYAMAVELGGDGYTSGNIIIISTVLSSVTLTLFIYTMLAVGLL
ncbi:MAG: AEC family transporter [Defluviitaleaceae bacterium]|nr:AEC family transporter [Defluviitaleaceae bacterium]